MPTPQLLQEDLFTNNSYGKYGIFHTGVRGMEPLTPAERATHKTNILQVFYVEGRWIAHKCL